MNKQLALDIRLRDDATYATYIGLAGIQLQAARGWVYVSGEEGTGKSHLLQAACHLEQDSIYLSQLEHLAPEILTGLEGVALLCIDDIEVILGDAAWEEALFHALNSAKDQGNTIMLAGRSVVGQLTATLPDLRSRLRSAVGIQTDLLNDDQKLELLMQRADRRGFKLGTEVGRFILSRAGRDTHKLLAMLERLEVETLRQQKKVTIPFVKQTLSL